MNLFPQVLFAISLLVAAFLLFRRIKFIKSNIMMGKPQKVDGPSRERWLNLLLVAFGQKKMFKRPMPAILHFFVYIGFLVINVEVLEFVLDGLFGTHRMFAPYLGSFYGVLMNIFEFLAIAVLVSCIVFLLRRNIAKIKRFWSAEMTSWPRLDANLILVTEVVLMIAILTMNATDQLLQARMPDSYLATGTLMFSSYLIPLFTGMSDGALVATERIAWWFHIWGILGFAVYVTYSKHLHIFMAFPNTYFGSIQKKGKMNNMQVVTDEVKSMLGLAPAPSGETPPGRFGAKDISDLSRKHLMAAYACTECGRCTSVCPANLTGKKLSPRKIMMDVRDRMEDVAKELKLGKLDESKALLGNYITKEELNACTSCNACVEACPVLINPLEIIIELRRYVCMEESGTPAQWNAMFQNIETSFAPWKFSPSDRFNWAKED